MDSPSDSTTRLSVYAYVVSPFTVICFFSASTVTDASCSCCISDASCILVSIWLPVGTILFGQQGKWGLSQGHLYELYAITIFLCLMAIFRHRKNIGRLLNGTESKLGQKAK